jgi:ferritin-like metal-binding protein YciE
LETVGLEQLTHSFGYRTTAPLTFPIQASALFLLSRAFKISPSDRIYTQSNQQQGGIMKDNTLNTSHVTELLYQALETEKGGVQIYTTALRCALNKDLKEEWTKYLEQTKTHVQVVSNVMKGMNLDTEVETPGRKIVRHIGDSLVKAMEMALRGPDPAAAQIVAAECVTLAETKDHLNWGLIGELTKNAGADTAAILKQAHDQVEPEEDEHLYHTGGWTRELWIEALGLPAVLPPPEEEQDVKTAIEAARAKKSRAKSA